MSQLKKLKNKEEIDIIKGKLHCFIGVENEHSCASKEDILNFLKYVKSLEELVEEASQQDFYGTEGWQHKIGLE